VREENITDWRRKTFGNLTSAFRFEDAKANPPILPETGDHLSEAFYSAMHLPKPPIPSKNQKVPKQEQGTRKRIGAPDQKA
jgi:phospholipase C